jgi:hypothetical protein
MSARVTRAGCETRDARRAEAGTATRQVPTP